MFNGKQMLVRRSLSRASVVAVIAVTASLWATVAGATITQGDFSIFGTLQTRWSGRWGEGGAKGQAVGNVTAPGGAIAARSSGGSFDFNRWDLVQARTLADLRPDYHMVKNYNLFGRFDTLFIKDADAFAIYRPWYDAFADLKQKGRAEKGKGWNNYTNVAKQQEFIKNDLREYYAQLTFTDNFSARIGKQQVIWSEADALAGSDVTNPSNLKYHWVHFESPEDQRKNLRMIKVNYILPDFFKTANNEFDAFVIPGGDYEAGTTGGQYDVNTTDARSPYIVPVPGTPSILFNGQGVPTRHTGFLDANNTGGGIGQTLNFGGPILTQNLYITGNKPSNSLDNSEFGARYSTLLPVGNGLQISFIYQYVARSNKTNIGINQATPAGTIFKFAPGLFVTAGCNYGTQVSVCTKPSFGSATGSNFQIFLRDQFVRANFIAVTGTYYDKDLTDIVYRYDFSYQPKTSGYIDNGAKGGAGPAHPAGGKWVDETRWIIAADRPTYIPWISKQHTFFTAQYVMTYYPQRPNNLAPSIANVQGKTREMSNFSFVSAVNWLMNGQLVTTNVVVWDWDNRAGSLISTNTYRYSRNILFGANAVWYQGTSGHYTDPFAASKSQRINELEFRMTYEI
jgi:hypothetical protein